MASNKDEKNIPIRFLDAEEVGESFANSTPANMDTVEPDSDTDEIVVDTDSGVAEEEPPVSGPTIEEFLGGPDTAELVATRSELKRIEAENAELRDRLTRRQADFENYRKRGERERAETYQRVAVDISAKLLPVLDNLKRALEAEASVEATESDEFRHFLSGVDLINRQLNGVLEALGVKPIPAVGEHFNPQVHEAVFTEDTDEYEPDTVMQEILTGYRLGDKLIRPALVKVARRG